MTHKSVLDMFILWPHVCSKCLYVRILSFWYFSLDIGPKQQRSYWTSLDGQTKLCLAQKMDDAKNCCICGRINSNFCGTFQFIQLHLKRLNYPLDAVYLISFFFLLSLGEERCGGFSIRDPDRQSCSF
jgi:hypothetical protein